MTETAVERAARWVREHPTPICRDFVPQWPNEFWCGTCGWNRPLHVDEAARAAVADALAQQAATPEQDGEQAEGGR